MTKALTLLHSSTRVSPAHNHRRISPCAQSQTTFPLCTITDTASPSGAGSSAPAVPSAPSPSSGSTSSQQPTSSQQQQPQQQQGGKADGVQGSETAATSCSRQSAEEGLTALVRMHAQYLQEALGGVPLLPASCRPPGGVILATEWWVCCRVFLYYQFL